jgi:hypothetical protein
MMLTWAYPTLSTIGPVLAADISFVLKYKIGKVGACGKAGRVREREFLKEQELHRLTEQLGFLET